MAPFIRAIGARQQNGCRDRNDDLTSSVDPSTAQCLQRLSMFAMASAKRWIVNKKGVQTAGNGWAQRQRAEASGWTVGKASP